MYERFIFLPITICCAFIVFYFHLAYFSAGVLIGIAVVLFDLVRGRDEIFNIKAGYGFLAIGIALLMAAEFVCRNYGFSFDELDHQKSLPKFVRNLPGIGVGMITMGLIIIIKSVFGAK
jgi:hypothetical protein